MVRFTVPPPALGILIYVLLSNQVLERMPLESLSGVSVKLPKVPLFAYNFPVLASIRNVGV